MAGELSWLERTTHNRKVKSSSLFLATKAGRKPADNEHKR